MTTADDKGRLAAFVESTIKFRMNGMAEVLAQKGALPHSMLYIRMDEDRAILAILRSFKGWSAALEAKDTTEGRAGNEGSGGRSNPVVSAPSSPRPDSKSKAKDIDLEGLKKAVEANMKNRRKSYRKGTLSKFVKISELEDKWFLKLIAAATVKHSEKEAGSEK
jgi:hypothetical protein